MTRGPVRPILAVLYVVTVAVAVFFVDDPFVLALGTALQVVLAAATTHEWRLYAYQLKKLGWFAAMIIVVYAVFGQDAGPQRLVRLPLWPWPLDLNGVWFGVAMVLRIALVVVASAWVRRLAGVSGFVRGLEQLRVPQALSQLLDRALLLMESGSGRPEGRGTGGGGGGGMGRHRAHDTQRVAVKLQQILRGDITFLQQSLERSLNRAARVDGAQDSASRDLAVLSGLLVMMLTIKSFKVLPGLPFAPGHKGVVLLPIYLLAARMTKRRGSATLLGTAFGILAFLFGDGRYGIFEILKHIAPGMIADALLPFIKRGNDSFWRYAVVGVLMAAGRLATIAVVVILIDAPEAMIAALVPVALVHLFFGAASGVVSRLLRHSSFLEEAPAASAAPEAEQPRARYKV